MIEGDPPGGAGGVMAIRLVLEIIEALAARESVGITELAKALGSTKGRVFRHLRTLVDQGYAIQDEGTERYAAGPRLLAVARVAAQTPDEALLRLARPVMHRLRDAVGFTVNLSLVRGDTASIIETLPGTSFIDVVMRTHSSMPLHSTAAGKLLLADRLCRTGKLPALTLEKFTDSTITDPKALQTELTEVQQRGWAIAPEETMLGINALSAPVHDHRRELIAMISVLSSVQFIPREPAASLIGAVRDAAREITEALTL